MTDSTYPSLPYDSGGEASQDQQASEKSTSPGGRKEVKWEVVAQAPGLVPATIIANRLKSEGIPAHAWQEGAGVALGLTVGLLGTGYVSVPEEFAEQALTILASEIEDVPWDESEDWDEAEDYL